MSTVTLVPHGTLNGAQTYRTPDGRFTVASSVTGAARARGVQRARWWVATDSTQCDPASPRYPPRGGPRDHAGGAQDTPRAVHRWRVNTRRGGVV